MLFGHAVTAGAALWDTLLFLAIAWYRGQGESAPSLLATAFQISIVGRGVTLLILGPATVVAFLVWCYRAQRNLPALGNEGLKYGPWTSVLCYFVPIANLFWPVLTMRELWHGSDPADFATPGGHYGRLRQRGQKTPRLVWWWWASLLVSGLAISAAEGMREHVVDKPELGPTAWTYAGLMLVAAWSLRLATSLVAARLVSTIDTFQRQRWTALQSHDAASLRRVR